MQRMHNPDREAKKADRIHRSKTLKMKAPATDFESFVFKCRVCMMGFRRRGMLVSKSTEYTLIIHTDIQPTYFYFALHRSIICLSVIQICVLTMCPS